MQQGLSDLSLRRRLLPEDARRQDVAQYLSLFATGRDPVAHVAHLQAAMPPVVVRPTRTSRRALAGDLLWVPPACPPQGITRDLGRSPCGASLRWLWDRLGVAELLAADDDVAVQPVVGVGVVLVMVIDGDVGIDQIAGADEFAEAMEA